MKKSSHILFFTFLIALLGILSFILVPGRRAILNINFLYQLSGWISPLNLVIFNSWGKWYTYAINLFFVFLLLVGGVIFAINKKEIRLIRLVFSLVFLSGITDILSLTLRLFFPYPGTRYDGRFVFDITTSFLSIIFFIGVSWYVLRLLKSLRTLLPNQATELFPKDEWHRSSQGARFLHFLVDDILALLVVSKIVFVFAYTGKAEMLIHLLGRNGALGLAILVFRIMYYTLSELTLQATAAKFLTESRVIDSKGNHPGFFNILLRTVCRFIPFDNFSFLWQGNWHDRLSNTWVVKEKPVEQ